LFLFSETRKGELETEKLTYSLTKEIQCDLSVEMPPFLESLSQIQLKVGGG
jgi:hypothetical protein